MHYFENLGKNSVNESIYDFDRVFLEYFFLSIAICDKETDSKFCFKYCNIEYLFPVTFNCISQDVCVCDNVI